MDKDLTALNEKVDFLLEYVEEQRKRQQAMDELKNDMIPIGNHLIKLTIDELAEIGNEFQFEDLLFLVKRVLRNTHLFIDLMDRMEAIIGIADEMEILGPQMFQDIVQRLDEMERKGYFAFATEGMNMLDRIVTEFDEEDAKALSDNVVTIVKTMRNMTQPDIMNFANVAVGAVRDADVPETAPSALSLMRDMNDPQVRKGMARMLNMMKMMAETDGVTPQMN